MRILLRFEITLLLSTKLTVFIICKACAKLSSATTTAFSFIDFHLLDETTVLLLGNEDRHDEVLSTGLQPTKRILQIRFLHDMRNLEGSRRIAVEESLQDLPGLSAAGFVAAREDRDLQCLIEPTGQILHIATGNVTFHRRQDVFAYLLCLQTSGKAERK